VIPEAASSILASHPKRRWQSGNAAVRKTVVPKASVVRSHPGALNVLVAQWIARVVPNYEVDRSNRSEDTRARVSLAREADCKSAVAGFNSRRVSTARRPRDKGNGLLSRECAFESRRADGGAHAR
jgi:hypothetical protein